jgi:hypothetical protein
MGKSNECPKCKYEITFDTLEYEGFDSEEADVPSAYYGKCPACESDLVVLLEIESVGISEDRWEAILEAKRIKDFGDKVGDD